MESGRNSGPDLIPPSVGLSRVGGGVCGQSRRKPRQRAHVHKARSARRGQRMSSWPPLASQAEAGNHSEGAGLKSKLSSLRSLLSLYQKAES